MRETWDKDLREDKRKNSLRKLNPHQAVQATKEELRIQIPLQEAALTKGMYMTDFIMKTTKMLNLTLSV